MKNLRRQLANEQLGRPWMMTYQRGTRTRATSRRQREGTNGADENGDQHLQVSRETTPIANEKSAPLSMNSTSRTIVWRLLKT